ncbi:LacI family DNA-binding transcriptional regulator [Schaalia sp. 19OD2882]|uniref:LacI family DNA-binding transcriptional regulator n=1 Tax=Schaalia sp. 19OD2882 TaxID=2794089 RepID=UPI001C1EB1D4|nr:LacI family DNA-binding transcriptional regulator [Schaalia sp. 19OD2882]QWW20216.1 LacI family DNA-binding transcriptional regulator [Schaalia sp. 19OD2882]
MAQTESNVAMADIAAAAGVAVSTVSRALSGAPGVSAQKREEILAIARRLGYLTAPATASTSAGLAAGGPPPARPVSGVPLDSRWLGPGARPARITAVVPESDRWVFGSILAGIHDVLGPLDVSLRVKQGLSDSTRAAFLADPHLADEIDLVILVPAPRDIPVQALKELPVAVVIAGTVVEGVASVGIDDIAVGHMATNYLRNVGLTSIAYAGFLDHEGTYGVATRRRGVGYRQAMEKAGLRPRFVQAPYSSKPGRAATELLLASEELPQGVICSSDEIAADMIATFRQVGVDIPGDISVIGVDGHPVASMMGLTTIAQPAREQGQRAAELALQILAAPSGPSPAPVTLPTRLVVRGSTRRFSV